MAHYAIMAMAFLTSWSKVSNIAFACFILFWLLSGNFQEKWINLKRTPIGFLALIWLGWIALSTLWSPADTKTQKVIFEQHLTLLAIPLLTSIITDERSQLNILKAYYWGIIVLMLSSIAQILGWQGGHIGFRYGQIEYSGLTSRVLHGPSVALMIYLSIIFTWKFPRYRLALIGFAAWGVIDLLFIIFSRTSLLILMPLLLTASIIVSIKSINKKYAVILILVMAAILFALFPQILARINSVAQELNAFTSANAATSSGVRLYYLQLTWRMFLEHPIIGHGIGAFRDLIHNNPEHVSELSRHWHSHNTYMNSLADFGLIGLAIYLGILATFIRNILNQSNSVLKHAAVGGLITIIMCGMTDSVIHLLGYMPMIFIALSTNFEKLTSNVSIKEKFN